jgi:hypothetical protein
LAAGDPTSVVPVDRIDVEWDRNGDHKWLSTVILTSVVVEKDTVLIQIQVEIIYTHVSVRRLVKILACPVLVQITVGNKLDGVEFRYAYAIARSVTVGTTDGHNGSHWVGNQVADHTDLEITRWANRI